MEYILALAAALRFISLGGGLYEIGLIDPVWPRRPDIVRPSAGGISRRRFWIPVHIGYEIAMIAALAVAWPAPDVRLLLLIAFAAHIAMRIWSAVRFIPEAARFERWDPALTDADAARWVRGSRWRLPLDLISAAATMAALIASVRA